MQNLSSAAVKAGWEEEEVLVALVSLADNMMLSRLADETLLSLLREIHRGRTGGSSGPA
ncbi:MAG TPA: hypothetical protein VGO22_15190 [Pseudorhizobium sp.]|nr:hypothetical protein [Pseudorhizobium sp.]